jgi:ACS family hexuronate transporter-like MFS transporter
MNPTSEAEKGIFQIRRLRWCVWGLLFAATVLNYVDRQVFSILAPDLQREIGWSELGYGRIVIAFQVSYAVCLVLSGRVIDKIGTKLGYSIAVIWWSIAEMAHAWARNPLGFGVARLFLGAGEAANFPTAMKAIAEWFPRSERGFAIGIFNGAPTVGAIAAPMLVPLIAASYGWRATFILTGTAGMVWLIAWWALYQRPEIHPRITREELELIQEGRSAAKSEGVPLVRLLRCRQTWAYAIGKVLADPAWFFYLFWLPKFLAQEHGLRGTTVIPYLTVVYVLSGVGSAIGGYVSSALIRRGWTVNWARKVPMGVSAVMMPVVILASQSRDPWTAVLVVGLATAAHQSWSSLVFTLGTDMFPSRAMGSVTGLAGGLGSVATILFAELTGRILQHNASLYLPMFVACGTMYLVSLAIIHLLVPRLEPAVID